jgi:hypothetical protein
LLKAEGGPVAVYGGSRVTMPYGMSVMGTALMEEYFGRGHATLGDAIMAAKRRMMAPRIRRGSTVCCWKESPRS